MMMKRIIIFAAAAVVVAACVTAVMIMSGESNVEVELELKWVLSEGKYIQMNITVGDVVYGDVVYGDGGAGVKITELGEERREGEAPNIVIIRTARGVVLHGDVREGMNLHVMRNGVAIPEMCIPDIKVKKIIRK